MSVFVEHASKSAMPVMLRTAMSVIVAVLYKRMCVHFRSQLRVFIKDIVCADCCKVLCQ